MARIRTIKPEFCVSEQIAECSTNARLLFVLMWMFCDDQGVHPRSVRKLKMECFPSDPFTVEDVQGWMDELLSQGLVREFEADGEWFWWVSGWKKHQKIDRPSYKFPAPPDNLSSSNRRAFDESSSSATPRKGRERKGYITPLPPRTMNTPKTTRFLKTPSPSTCRP